LGLRTELTLQHTATDDVVVDLPDIGVYLAYSCQSLAENFSLPLCKYSGLFSLLMFSSVLLLFVVVIKMLLPLSKDVMFLALYVFLSASLFKFMHHL